MNKFRFSVLLLLVFLAGCASRVNVDFDAKTPFQALKTYQINPNPDVATRDSRLNSPLISQRIVRVVGFTLNNKGFVSVPSQPDFTVLFRIDKAQELQAERSGFTFGVGSFGSHVGTGVGFNAPIGDVQSYDRGVLTIDIVSASGQLIWRGSSSRRIFDGSTPATADQLVYEIVTEILNEFPPLPAPVKPS